MILVSSKKNVKDILLSIRNAANTATLRFYLVLINQLKGLDPRYELYLLLTALEDPDVSSLNTPKEGRDMLY